MSGQPHQGGFRIGATRTDHPYSLPAPNPRAVELAQTVQEIMARDGNVTEGELRSRGFSYDEIIEHQVTVDALIKTMRSHSGDSLSAIVEKVAHGFPFVLPTMPGNPPSQKQIDDWQHYCRARAALRLDPTPAQADRVSALLGRYFNHLPLLPAEKEQLCRRADQTINAILSGATGGRP